jgi:serine/threonine-protein kinase
MSMGFQVGDITFVENDEIPRGLVINQFIPPGSKLPYGYSIGFQVSLGNSDIIVPLLTGYTLDEARGILFDIGLYLHVIEYIPGDGTYSSGTIIEQSIQAGETARQGDSLNIKIAN